MSRRDGSWQVCHHNRQQHAFIVACQKEESLIEKLNTKTPNAGSKVQ